MTDEAAGAPLLASLLLRFRPVVAKRAGLVLGLWGEAGVGKTHVAGSLLGGLSCRSFSVHAALPLIDLLKELPRPPRLPLWARPALERLERGEHLGEQAAADAVAALLAALAPVVLHLEDLHEALPERQELWAALAGRAGRTRGVALITTSRTLPPEPFEAQRLEPLGEEASVRLLEGELGVRPPEEAAGWIYSRACGNPLFTLEFLRYLTRQGFLWNDARRWHWRAPPHELVPVTVEALIEQLIVQAHPSQSAKEALEAAAMLPLDAPLALWPALADLSADALGAATLELERLGIFRNGTFVHPLFREVVLRGLGPARRRVMARRALAALEEDPQTATSFVDDAGLEPDEAQAFLESAAQAARERGDEVRAARFLGCAAAYAAGEAKADLALSAAQALRDADFGEALRLAELAARLQPENAEALYLAAELLAQQGRMAEAEGLLQGLPGHDAPSSRWWAILIRLRLKMRDRAGAVAIWADHPELHASDDPELLCDISLALSALGEREQALALVGRAFQLELTPLQRCRLLNVLAGCHFLAGEQVEAQRVWSEALRLAQEVGNLRWTANVHLNRSFAGSNEASLHDLERACRLFAEIGDMQSYYHAKNYLGQAYIFAAEYLQAEDALLECRDVATRLGLMSNLFLSEIHLSALYCAWRPPHGGVLALKHARAALALASELHNPSHRIRALAQLAQVESWWGDAQRGLALAQEELALATELEQPTEICDAQVTKALALEGLGRAAEALKVLRDAEASAQHQGLESELPKIRFEIARLTRDSESAARQLTYFEAQGLKDRASIVRRHFPELSVQDAEGVVRNTAAAPELPAELPRLAVLGPLVWENRGKREAVKGQKRRELLALLLEARIAGRTEAPQLELLDGLYPGEPEEAAAGSLKQLVFQLRKSLGAGTILRTSGGYALGAVASDAESFLTGSDTGLWRGRYREDAGEGDETVASALYHALRLKAAELLSEHPTEAARLGRLLLEHDPYDAESLRLTLKALWAMGKERALEGLYRQSRDHLAEVGERLPEAWADFLAQQPAHPQVGRTVRGSL